MSSRIPLLERLYVLRIEHALRTYFPAVVGDGDRARIMADVLADEAAFTDAIKADCDARNAAREG